MDVFFILENEFSSSVAARMTAGREGNTTMKKVLFENGNKLRSYLVNSESIMPPYDMAATSAGIRSPGTDAFQKEVEMNK